MLEWSRPALASALLLLGGCASHTAPPLAVPGQQTAPAPSPPQGSSAAVEAKPQLPHYRCDGGVAFDVRFGDGTAELLFTAREAETVLRDAGGTTPQQTVYSSTRLKVEFGLDPQGRGAKLNFVAPPLEARCLRD